MEIQPTSPDLQTDGISRGNRQTVLNLPSTSVILTNDADAERVYFDAGHGWRLSVTHDEFEDLFDDVREFIEDIGLRQV